MFDQFHKEFEEKGTVTFYVKVRPDAPMTKALGKTEDACIKIAIAAPARGNKANRKLMNYLSKEFSVPQSQVEIISGHGSRQKLVRVTR